MLNNLRPQVAKVLNPLAKQININPNIITLSGLVLAIISGYLFYQQELIWGAILILISGLLDLIDGAVARNTNSVTPFGGFLDSTVDRLSDAAIIIGIIAGGYVNWFIGVLAVHASITVSYVRARSEVENVPCAVGIGERAERLAIIVFGAFISAIYSSDLMMWFMILLVIIGYFTVLQRVIHTWNSMQKQF
jgi:archaetidylinositol phosphate synthase